MTPRALRAACAALLLALAPPAAAAVLGFDRAGDAFAPSPGFRLGAGPDAGAVPAAPERGSAAQAPVPSSPAKLFDRKTAVLTAGVVVGVPVLGYFAWWKDTTTSHFTVAHEGWFGEDTYAGGADKASHIFFSYLGTQILQGAYRSLGKTPAASRGLALGVTVLTGVLVELGDGFSQYGFSWEDATANAIGGLVATGIDALTLDDTVGLRWGVMSTPIPPPCCRYGGYGDDYSKEIYTLDLKLAGLLPRVGTKPGLLRFLLLSGTYQSKGYRYSPPESRRREIGIEVGLNVREILVAAGVPGSTWWGKALLGFTKYFRIPYTAIGYRYDLNSHTWTGPNSGEGYDPGYILYD